MADIMKLQVEPKRPHDATNGLHRAPPLGHLLADKVARDPETPDVFANTKSTTQTGTEKDKGDTDSDVD